MNSEFVIFSTRVNLWKSAFDSVPGNITLTNARLVYTNAKTSVGIPVSMITGTRDGVLGLVEIFYNNTSVSFAFMPSDKKVFLARLQQIVSHPEEEMSAFPGSYALPQNPPVKTGEEELVTAIMGRFYHCDDKLIYVSNIIRTEDVVMPYREITNIRFVIGQLWVTLNGKEIHSFAFDNATDKAEANKLIDLVTQMQEYLRGKDRDEAFAEEKSMYDDFISQYPVTGKKASYSSKALWVSGDKLCICNLFDESHPEFVGTAVALDEIDYYSIVGKIEKETVTTGDTAAALGEALFGSSYKAAAGSAKHNMKTKTIEHDNRYVELKLISGEPLRLFLEAYDSLQIVIPEKEKSVVDEVRHNQAVNKSKAPSSDVATDTEKVVKAIQSLAELEKAGILTKEEFELKKKQLLGL